MLIESAPERRRAQYVGYVLATPPHLGGLRRRYASSRDLQIPSDYLSRKDPNRGSPYPRGVPRVRLLVAPVSGSTQIREKRAPRPPCLFLPSLAVIRYGTRCCNDLVFPAFLCCSPLSTNGSRPPKGPADYPRL